MQAQIKRTKNKLDKVIKELEKKKLEEKLEKLTVEWENISEQFDSIIPPETPRKKAKVAPYHY